MKIQVAGKAKIFSSLASKSVFWISALIFVLSIFYFIPQNAVEAAPANSASNSNGLIKGKKVRVGYIYSPNFSEGAADNAVKSGFAYDYLQKISYYANWNYEYVYGAWEDLLQMLYDGEIDIMAGVSKTPERLDSLLFPDYAMGSENYYIYTIEGNPLGAKGINGISGCTVSVNRNSIMESILRDWNDKGNRQINIKTYSGSDERYSDFEAGKAEATVDTDNAISAESRLVPLTKIGQSEYFLAVSKNKPDILSELNAALDRLNSTNPYFAKKLSDLYFSELSVSTTLQNDEIEWLSSHPDIVVGYLDDYLPLCDMDENGNPTGSMMDIINEMLTDLKLKDKVNMSFVAYNSYESMLSDLQTGVVDVAFPVNNDVALAEKS
ncbi:MAG: transporter substrate-binding domain-containing protein, partial [Schwartzia sp.]|nr:transporter substrate-binding domain-containing protein [Schwartzia sp. (in: firmicutes)]